jgi:hypothetical protein
MVEAPGFLFFNSDGISLMVSAKSNLTDTFDLLLYNESMQNLTNPTYLQKHQICLYLRNYYVTTFFSITFPFTHCKHNYYFYYIIYVKHFTKFDGLNIFFIYKRLKFKAHRKMESIQRIYFEIKMLSMKRMCIKTVFFNICIV